MTTKRLEVLLFGRRWEYEIVKPEIEKLHNLTLSSESSSKNIIALSLPNTEVALVSDDAVEPLPFLESLRDLNLPSVLITRNPGLRAANKAFAAGAYACWPRATGYDGLAECINDVYTRYVEKEQARAAERMATASELGRAAAHDFNNLLGIILGYAEIALSDASNRDIPSVLRSIMQITLAANKCKALTTKLLSGTKTRPPAPANLDALLNRMLETIRIALDRKVEFVYEPSGANPYVKVNPEGLERVLLNLALNANHAMIRTKQKKLVIGTNIEIRNSQPYAHIRIADTGCGIPAKHLAQIFTPFFTTKAPEEGTGIGLAYVYQTIKRFGGEITVESERGEGTTFYICLPIIEAPRVERKSLCATPIENILLIEPSDGVRYLAEYALKKAGYKVTASPEGTAAFKRDFLLQEPDLLIADITIPGGRDGMQIASQLCEQYPELRVLFTPSALPESYVEQANVAYLQKPYQIKKLLEKIKELEG